jgi:hypothetical protein
MQVGEEELTHIEVLQLGVVPVLAFKQKEFSMVLEARVQLDSGAVNLERPRIAVVDFRVLQMEQVVVERFPQAGDSNDLLEQA